VDNRVDLGGRRIIKKKKVRTIGNDQYDVEKEFFIKTQRRKGVGRVGEGIEVTAVL
jgi:hypothetical protein